MGRGKKIEAIVNRMPTPDKDQTVAKITHSPGANLVKVVDPNNRPYLVRVPAKYKGAVWIRNGSYAIVDSLPHLDDNADNPTDNDRPKVHGNLAHLLYREQIKHLVKSGLWPDAFREEPSAERADAATEYGAAELISNPNHRFRDVVDESDDDESDDESSGAESEGESGDDGLEPVAVG